MRATAASHVGNPLYVDNEDLSPFQEVLARGASSLAAAQRR